MGAIYHGANHKNYDLGERHKKIVNAYDLWIKAILLSYKQGTITMISMPFENIRRALPTLNDSALKKNINE